MKIIYRYIIREFLESFIFGMLVFSSILLLDQVFQLIDLFLRKGISFFTIIHLFILILPNIFSLTIPMAGLLAILLSFGRLSEDNEITALRSSGVAYARFTVPVLVIALIFSVFLAHFNQNLSPHTHRQFRKLYQEILSQQPLVKFEERSIASIGEYRIYVENIDKKTNLLKGVNIYKFSHQPDDTPWRISASSAVVSVNQAAIVFGLAHGYWQQPNPAHPEKLIHMNFSHYQFTIPLGTSVMPFSQSLREMTGKDLRREIRAYKAKKMPTNFLENEYWLRWTLALAPFVFALAGIPLAIAFEKGGKSVGFGFSMGILFVYYLLLVAGINIGEKGYVAPGVILWLPDAATMLTGLFLWKRMLKY